jgi:hypothetical protein
MSCGIPFCPCQEQGKCSRPVRGMWKDPSFPGPGWRWMGFEDLGQTIFKCEACGKPDIRYVHTMKHEQRTQLLVGCVCASYMAPDQLEDITAADKSMRKEAGEAVAPKLTLGLDIVDIEEAFHLDILPLRLTGGVWRGWVISKPVFCHSWSATAKHADGVVVSGIHETWIVGCLANLVKNIIKAERHFDQADLLHNLKNQVQQEWALTGTTKAAPKDNVWM